MISLFLILSHVFRVKGSEKKFSIELLLTFIWVEKQKGEIEGLFASKEGEKTLLVGKSKTRFKERNGQRDRLIGRVPD